MSSSTVSKRPNTGDRKMNSSFAGREGLNVQQGGNANLNMSNTTGSLNKMMNNFMSEGNEEDKENSASSASHIVRNYRSNTNIPLPTASKLPLNRPRSNQSSELKTRIFNKRTTQSNTNMGYGTMNGFMRDQPRDKSKNNKDLKEQVKSFQNFSNPWYANSSFKSNEPNGSEQATASQPMFKAKKPKKNSIMSSDRRILSKLTTNTFSIRGNSPGGRLIYK
jgi:hypothetical protein